jgi:hypothetical protein
MLERLVSFILVKDLKWTHVFALKCTEMLGVGVTLECGEVILGL